MTVASGTRRGSADSTPSTSVQMWISHASSSAPKIEAEKSLPLRPSVVCTPRRSEAMKPVMTSVPCEVRRHLGREVGARLGPLDAGAERTPFHHYDPPRIEPLHRPGAAGALVEEALEQPRRPDLAVTGDQIADIARGGTGAA